MVDKGRYFGALAVSARFITKEQLDECLAVQAAIKAEGKVPPRLGEILEEKGYLTQKQLEYLLETMHTTARGPFGKIAVNLHFVTSEQVQLCLRIQEYLKKKSEKIPFIGPVAERYAELEKRSRTWGRVPRIGEILYEMGYIKPHQIEIVLKEQGKAIVKCTACKASFDVSNFSVGDRVRCGQCRMVLEIAEDWRTGKLTTTEVQDKKGIPKTLGEFQIGRQLGKDGPGVVHEAFQQSKNRKVALKIFYDSAMEDKEFARQLFDEVRKVAKFEHPHIRGIHKFGRVKDRFYMAMEYLEGASIMTALRRGGRFSYRRAVEIAMCIAEALEYAHERGVLHRDLRPSNIFLTKDGIVKLVNLGMASKTLENIMLIVRSGEVAPFYIAPEQVIEGMTVDERCDIYGLGAILYHMIAGRPPYEGRSPLEIMVRVTGEAGTDIRPPMKFFDPSIPDALEAVVNTMLEALPDRRYPNFSAVIRALGETGIVETRRRPGKKWEPDRGIPECQITHQQIEVESPGVLAARTVQVVCVKGSLDPGNFPTLERTLAALSQKGQNKIVLDCGEVSYMSSVALDGLTSFASEIRKSGGDLRLSNVSESVKKGIEAIGGAKKVRVYDSTHGAAQSFKYL